MNFSKYTLHSNRILVVLLFIQLSLTGQEIMTLQKAMSIGLENNLGIQIAENNIKIAELNNNWAEAGRTPTIDLNGQFNNTYINDNNPASFLRGSYYIGSLGASVDASYTVYSGGRFGINKLQLEEQTKLAGIEKRVVVETLLKNISDQYYAILFEEERAMLLDETLQLSKDRLSYEEVKAQFGNSSTFNKLQFENALLIDSLNREIQNRTVNQAKQAFYTLLRVPIGSNYTFSEKLPMALENINREKLKDALLSENLNLQNLEVLREVNALSVELARAARRPLVNVNASLGWNENAFDFFGNNPNNGEPIPLTFSNRLTASAGVNFTWNVYDGGQRNRAIQVAQINANSTELNRVELTANLLDQLDLLIDNYESQKEMILITSKQIELASTNLNIAKDRFQNGQINSLDYRTLQIQQLNASINHLNTLYGLLLFKNNIDQITGNFNER